LAQFRKRDVQSNHGRFTARRESVNDGAAGNARADNSIEFFLGQLIVFSLRRGLAIAPERNDAMRIA
jgi:hypothetical protein